MAKRNYKINGIIQRELSEILQKEVRNSALKFCTITSVNVTNDLSQATIYVQFLDKSYANAKGMQALEKSKGFMRSLLAKRLTVRKCPELIFKLDTSLDYGNHIEDLLKEIHEKEQS